MYFRHLLWAIDNSKFTAKDQIGRDREKEREIEDT